MKNRVKDIIRQTAMPDGVTEQEVRRALQEAIDVARSSPDPAVQQRWRTIPRQGR